jgi:thiamine biosynthesis lipoprotein
MRSASWQALGTKAVLVVTDPVALPSARAILAEELWTIDRACSRFRADSELSRLNAAAGSRVHVGPLLYDAVRTALEAAAATGGLVAPTVGASLRRSGYDRTFAAVRDRAGTLRPAFVRSPDWRHIELDEERRTIWMRRGVELDLGATAKALAADRAASAIFGRTGSGVLVSLGGDVSAAGEPPPGDWPIRIAEDSGDSVDVSGPVVTVAGGGLATSSTTVRRWASSEGELHHIVDPRTGRPAARFWRTATVAAASCVDANTASTAAIVLGEPALTWLAARRLPARLVRYDGAVARVAGWPAEAA